MNRKIPFLVKRKDEGVPNTTLENQNSKTVSLKQMPTFVTPVSVAPLGARPTPETRDPVEPAAKKTKLFQAPKRISVISQSLPQEVEPVSPSRYFKALFARPKEYNKKKKKFEDGILKVSAGKITLTSMDNTAAPLIKSVSQSRNVPR